MIKIYFGNDEDLNDRITKSLGEYHIEYEALTAEDITTDTFLEMMKQTDDFFDLLSKNLLNHKLDNKTTISAFIKKIMSDKIKYLALPIVDDGQEIYSNFNAEDVSRFLPRDYRAVQRKLYLSKASRIDYNVLFWEKFENLRKSSGMRWFDFNEKMFPDDAFDDWRKQKYAKDQFYSYKRNKTIPPEPILKKIQRIFLVEREELFY